MADPREIPQLTTELIDMSREYLRQETIEPAKRLGQNAGMGFGGAIVMSLGGMFMVFALYTLLKAVFPDDSDWWVVLARFLTALAAAGAAGLIGWRMSNDDNQ